MVHPGVDPQRFLAFQASLIGIVRNLPTGLYLGGRSAACRGYLNHRLTFDLQFTCCNQPEFGLWAEQVIDELARQTNLEVSPRLKEPRKVVMTVQQEAMALELTMLNDGPLHIGNLRKHPALGKLDSPENIAAQAVVAILNNPEPGDLADLLGLCIRFNLDIETLLQSPNSRAAGVFPPDLARALYIAGKRDWELVRWIQTPPQEIYLGQLRKLAVRLLALDEAQLRPPEPVQKISTLPLDIEQSQDAQEAIDVKTFHESQRREPAVSVETNVFDEPQLAQQGYRRQDATEPEPEPEPVAVEPPVIKRGTGILNYYRALKAAGKDGFADIVNTPSSPDENDLSQPLSGGYHTPEDPARLPKLQRVPSKPWSPTLVTGEVKPRTQIPAVPGGGLDSKKDPVILQDLVPSDKRKEPRRRISYYVPVINTLNEQPVGYLADISRKGMCLDSKEALVRGAKLSLRIDLPPELGPKSHIIFAAEVRWTRVDPTDANAYSSGLEVIQINNEDARSFLKIIEKYSYE